MNFDKAFELVLGHEGGLSMDKKDPGNWTGGKVGVGILKGTKYGISALAYPKEDILNLTVEKAKEIYKMDYWIKSGADRIPNHLSYIHFDCAVNQGVPTAVKILQRTAKVAEDGVVGVVTIEKSKSVTVAMYAMNRMWNYIAIIISNPKMIVYIKGWFNRIYSIVSYID